MQELEQYLWSLTVDDVKDLKRKLELSGTCKNKRDFIEIIMDFYRTPNWLEEYFSTLKGFDKEYATLMIQENFNPIYEEVSVLLKKYNVQRNWNGEIEDNLKFMIEGEVPDVFKPTLLKLVPPIEVVFTPVEKLTIDEKSICIKNTQNPLKKFDDFILFINKNKVKATDKKEYIPKSSILKFIKESGIAEVFKNWDNTIDEFKNQEDTVITNGIVSLLMCASVIMINKGYFDLGQNYSKYIKMSPIDKAKFLLDKYLNCRYIEINEIDRLTNCDFKYKPPLDLQKPRMTVVDYIKKLPMDSWILASDIQYFLRIKDVYFLRENVGEIVKKDSYRNWYYRPSFSELEGAFIDSVLIDYLSVLGIVDVYLYGTYDDYGENFFITADYVKLTTFGSCVLGLTEYETKEETVKPPIITSNYEIIIEESSKRTEYELYFDRFFEKTFEDASKVIYKLNFLGVAKSYDEDVDFLSYIMKECPNIPECVMDKFEDWIRTLGEITIKTVTILEAPEEILKSLLRNKKIAKYEKKSSLEHIIIPSKKSKEVKKSIEALELFCDIEE